MLSTNEELWIAATEKPEVPGWYPVMRFNEDGEPYKAECKRLYWCGNGWFYDEDCCVTATMNPDNFDVWQAKYPSFM